MVRILTPQAIKPFPETNLGIVEEVIMPNRVGRVHCYATSWPAQLDATSPSTVLMPNDQVAIVGRVGITLIVKPLNADR
jgi:membrane protein implicated in regulation of membrane protease activity